MQILAEGHRKSLLDPRTKLFLLFTITLVVVGGRHNALMAAPRILLTLIPFLLMLFEHRAGMAFSYAVLYAAAWWGSRMLVPVMHGFWGFLVLAFTGIISMMLPGFAIGADFLIEDRC